MFVCVQNVTFTHVSVCYDIYFPLIPFLLLFFTSCLVLLVLNSLLLRTRLILSFLQLLFLLPFWHSVVCDAEARESGACDAKPCEAEACQAGAFEAEVDEAGACDAGAFEAGACKAMRGWSAWN
jgi:hypothetical protein